jgi:hypothetical protein
MPHHDHPGRRPSGVVDAVQRGIVKSSRALLERATIAAEFADADLDELTRATAF